MSNKRKAGDNLCFSEKKHIRFWDILTLLLRYSGGDVWQEVKRYSARNRDERIC